MSEEMYTCTDLQEDPPSFTRSPSQQQKPTFHPMNFPSTALNSRGQLPGKGRGSPQFTATYSNPNCPVLSHLLGKFQLEGVC